MIKNLKTLSLLLSAVMLFSLLSGCQKSEEPSQSETENDTLVLSVESMPVYMDEFNYWMYRSIIYAGYDPSTEIDWTAEVGDQTLSEFVLSESVEAVRLYKAVELKSQEFGISLSDEDKANIASMIENDVAQFESKEQYNEYLETNMLSERLLEYIYSISYLHSSLFTEMYGEYGVDVSDEDALAFGDEHGYYRAKHILIRTVDDSGNSFSEDQLNDNREKLQGILNAIKVSDDPESKFDELMQENSEDPGVESYPDGYQFNANTISFDKSFLGEATSLEIGGFSQDIIEMEGMGYTILMRLPLDPDMGMISDSGANLRGISAAARYQTLLETWSQECSINYEDIFYTIKPEELFGKNAN